MANQQMSQANPFQEMQRYQQIMENYGKNFQKRLHDSGYAPTVEEQLRMQDEQQVQNLGVMQKAQRIVSSEERATNREKALHDYNLANLNETHKMGQGLQTMLSNTANAYLGRPA